MCCYAQFILLRNKTCKPKLKCIAWIPQRGLLKQAGHEMLHRFLVNQKIILASDPSWGLGKELGCHKPLKLCAGHLILRTFISAARNSTLPSVLSFARSYLWFKRTERSGQQGAQGNNVEVKYSRFCHSLSSWHTTWGICPSFSGFPLWGYFRDEFFKKA